jgi:nucleoside-diphosphate-sugar epimerase
MKKIILTGASGFIGRHCIQPLLDSDYHVHALYSGSAPVQEAASLHWHKIDLLDDSATADLVSKLQATHLLHLTWYAEPGKFWESMLNREWTHASMHLYEQFQKHGGQRLVGAGTCAEYDWSDGVLNETKTVIKPGTLYGQCKAELFSRTQEFSKNKKLSFAWGRIFWLYGPFEDKRRLVPYVITSLLSNEIAKCSEGSQKRDFMHVQDVANAFVALLNSNYEGAVNIGSGAAVAVKDLVETIGTQTGKGNLIQLGAVPTNKEEPPEIFAEASILKQIGFIPQYSIDAGLKQTIGWWKANREKQP